MKSMFSKFSPKDLKDYLRLKHKSKREKDKDTYRRGPKRYFG